MRTVHRRTGSASGRRPEFMPDSASPQRLPHGGRRGRGGTGPGQGSVLRGLRWVPVPLAALAVVIGVLVLGSLQGQVAAANAHQPGYRAGGLALSVDTMLWMMNMAPTRGYQMPKSEMAGMQAPGMNRLRVEITLSDVAADVQRYSTSDFSLSGHGKTWNVDGPTPSDPVRSDMATSALLEPGFQTVVNLYFDVPAKQVR